MAVEWRDVAGALCPFDDQTNDQLTWAPQEGSQVDFLTSPVFETLLEGPRGTGKTDVLLMDFAQHIGQGFGDNWSGILFRQTYPELDDVIAKSKRWFHRIFPEGSGNPATFNVGKNFWSWASGERLAFRHLQNASDYDKYHGHCLPPGTKVRLAGGRWKSIEQVVPYDWVVVPLSAGHCINLPVEFTTVDDYDGPMYTYRDYDVFMQCTQDHDVCVLRDGKVHRLPFHELERGDALLMGDFTTQYYRPECLKTEEYVGKVYCLGIPRLHRFVVQQGNTYRSWLSGNSYPWIAFEELTTWPTSELYRRMLSLCRGTAPGMPRKVRATTNPNGVGHNWVKKRFQLPVLAGNTIGTVVKPPDEKPRVAVHSRLEENKVLLHTDPDYVKNLRSAARNENERAAWIDGSWDITSGGMFDDLWDSNVHIVDNIIGHIPHSWRLDRSFDWGSSSPASVGWWAESDGTDLTWPDGTVTSTVRGDLFRIMEWYVWNGDPDNPMGMNLLAEDIARGIIQRQLDRGIHDIVRPGPADSSIFGVENGNCVASDMRMKQKINGRTYKGISWTRADKRPGSRMQGWQQIRKYLAGAKKPATLVREQPGLFICKECVDFIRTIPTLPRSEKNLDDIPTDHIEDHIADEARYRIRGKMPVTQGRVAGG